MQRQAGPASGVDRGEMMDHDLKHKAALSSVATSGALTALKLVAGIVSGSLALLSEAVHGAVDTGATLVTYFAVRLSGKPADEDHHFGHEKIEALAALFEVFLLLDVALVVFYEAWKRLQAEHTAVEVTPLIFGVLVLSIAVDLVRWRALHGIAKQTRSDALAADATHFFSDMIASLIVLVGLSAYVVGWKEADAVASFGVAAFIAFAGFRLARQTVDTLLDKAPEGMVARTQDIARAVPGVADVESVRLRSLGGRIVGDMTVGVSRTLSSERIVEIRKSVTDALQREEPTLDITVSALPRMLDDETILERVFLVAARRRMPVHHVTVQRIEGRRSVSFDLEVDGALPHGAAHEIATALEAAVRDEIGADVEVESHIEPLTVSELEGSDEPPDQIAAITQHLADAARGGGTVYDIHKVRARRTREGLVVNYHCRIDPSLTVSAVHDCVDALEHSVRAERPDIVRLVGHAEPPRSSSTIT